MKETQSQEPQRFNPNYWKYLPISKSLSVGAASQVKSGFDSSPHNNFYITASDLLNTLSSSKFEYILSKVKESLIPVTDKRKESILKTFGLNKSFLYSVMR